MNGINSIIDFLSTLPSIKSVLENQVIILKNLVFESITNIHMLDQLEDAIDGLVFLIDFFNEISNGIIETQIKLSKPKKIQLFFKGNFELGISNWENFELGRIDFLKLQKVQQIKN